jgi:hypothetical protein
MLTSRPGRRWWSSSFLRALPHPFADSSWNQGLSCVQNHQAHSDCSAWRHQRRSIILESPAFITGYAENAAGYNGYPGCGIEIPAKPFATATLADKVPEMLETQVALDEQGYQPGTVWRAPRLETSFQARDRRDRNSAGSYTGAETIYPG